MTADIVRARRQACVLHEASSGVPSAARKRGKDHPRQQGRHSEFSALRAIRAKGVVSDCTKSG